MEFCALSHWMLSESILPSLEQNNPLPLILRPPAPDISHSDCGKRHWEYLV